MKHLIFLFVFLTHFAFSQEVNDIINGHNTAMGLTTTPMTSYKFVGDFFEKYFLISSTNHYTCTVYFKSPDLWRIEKTDLNGGDPVLNESGILIICGNSSWSKKNNSDKVDNRNWGVFTNNLFMYTLPDYLCYTNVLTCKKQFTGIASGGTDAQFFVTVPNRLTEETGTRQYSTSSSTKYITSIYEYTDNKPEKAVELSDYKTVGGITYPAKIVDTYYPGGEFSWSFTKSNVEINIQLNDKLFEVPKAGVAVNSTQAVPTPVIQVGNLGELISLRKFDDAIALINAGADIKGTFFGTKLMNMAVQINAIDVAKLLVSRGADLNYPDPNNGYTPLHSAIHDGNFTMIIILTDGGANLNLIDEAGATPLKLATDLNFKDIAKYLKDKGAHK